MNQQIAQPLDAAQERTLGKQVGKVAAVTLSFWVMKIIATTVGDIAGDLLSETLGLGYVLSLLVAMGLVLSLLIAQVRTAGFKPALFWVLMLGTSTLGAELSDTLDRGLHLGYVVGAAVVFLCLAAALVAWRLRRGRIQVYPVFSRHEECYYWCAAILANTLGSVLGDLLGDHFGLGFMGAMAVNAAVLALLLLLSYTTKANRALLFWTAFIFSRV